MCFSPLLLLRWLLFRCNSCFWYVQPKQFFIPVAYIFISAFKRLKLLTRHPTKQLVKLVLAEGWSSIAVQRCSSIFILFTFLHPTSLPPPSLPPPSFPSSLTWMRREQHEGERKKKRGSSVSYWGSCVASLSFLPSHLFPTPLILSPCESSLFVIFLWVLSRSGHQTCAHLFLCFA